MSLRRAKPLTFRAVGASDTNDSTNLKPGAMAALTNLIPAPNTMFNWVPRPASSAVFSFAGFTGARRGELLFDSGRRVYGMIQSTRFPGKSEPFIFDVVSNINIPVLNVTVANCPTSTPNTGDWQSPSADQVGAFVVVTHPGFNFGAGQAFGWFDMTGFSSTTVTGDTHSNTTIDNLSTNVLTIGWTPGMTIADSAADLPLGTRIVSIAANGLSVVIDQAAIGSNSGTTFTVQGGSFAAPVWNAGNTSPIPLVNIATWVKQYGGSASFGVNTAAPPSAAVAFSDAGNALILTNANQIITFGNGIAVTALSTLGYYTQLGGSAASLLVFQGPTAIQNITGTVAQGNLAVNELNLSIGTIAPASLARSPKGVYFIAPDGLRRVDLLSLVSKVIGASGAGITTPFIYAINPTRICGAFQQGVYRVSVNNGFASGQPRQEWWYHEDEDRWSGPHSFPADVITPLAIPGLPFAMFATGVFGKLFESQVYPNFSQSFIENGTQMTFAWTTSLLPDTTAMAMNELIETALSIAIPAQEVITVSFNDEFGTLIGETMMTGPDNASMIWGQSSWGAPTLWGQGTTFYAKQIVQWTAPINFNQGQVTVTGNCKAFLNVGNLQMRYQESGYMLPTSGALM